MSRSHINGFSSDESEIKHKNGNVQCKLARRLEYGGGEGGEESHAGPVLEGLSGV